MGKIIALVGMPGAGKSEAGAFFAEKNIPVLRFGSVVEDGVREEGLERTAETERYYREKIRKELGMAAIAIKMHPKIEKAMQDNEVVVLDGLYSWEEYIFLKEKIADLFLLCIYAKPTIRYARLKERPIRPFNPEESRRRDIMELQNLNKGGPIAIADDLIKNETSKEHLHQELERFLQTI